MEEGENMRLEQKIHWQKMGTSWYGSIACDSGHRDLSKMKIKFSTSPKMVTCRTCAKLAIKKLEQTIEYIKEVNGILDLDKEIQ